MKYIIALLFALTFYKIDAQNLQFSQVLTYNLVDLQELTVPSNKVWKIESAKYYTGLSNAGLWMNGYCLACASIYNSVDHFPIWLKSSDVIKAQGPVFLSVIEFTIVP